MFLVLGQLELNFYFQVDQSFSNLILLIIPEHDNANAVRRIMRSRRSSSEIEIRTNIISYRQVLDKFGHLRSLIFP